MGEYDGQPRSSGGSGRPQGMRQSQSAMSGIPPQNRDAEDAILGAMIMNPQAIEVAVDVGLRDVDFYSPANRIIFQTIVDLGENEPVDAVTLVNELTRLGKLEEVGSSAAIVSLVERVPAIGNARAYAEIVRDQSMLRQIVTAGNEIARIGYEGAEEPAVVLDQAEQIVYDLAHQRESSDFVDAVNLLTPLYEEITERAEAGGVIPGTPTGFIDVDNLVGGFHPGALIIVGGRAAMGKTAFALNIVENVVLKSKKAVALFSLEMDAKELVQRMMCSVAKVDAHKVRVGKLDNDDYPRLVDAIGRITKAKNLLHIDQTAAITPMELRSKVRRLHSRVPGGLGLVVVDYLQIMEPSKRAENRQVEIAAMSRALKQLARELQVPVIAVSQLSRVLESRNDKRPMLSDLRESGAIEQDADMVMFVHRPEYYDRDNPDLRNKAELIVGKNRSGRVGLVDLTFLAPYTRFESAPRPHMESSLGAPPPSAQPVGAGSFPGPPPASAIAEYEDDGIY